MLYLDFRLHMPQIDNNFLSQEIKDFFKIKKTERKWHLPLVASICVAFPLLVSYFLDRIDLGMLCSSTGFLVLYMPAASLAKRMITVMVCAFGFLLSYALGMFLSFDPILGAFGLGVFAFLVHWVSNYFHVAPPGSFFFIMIATVVSFSKVTLAEIPFNLGLATISAFFTCLLIFIYSLYVVRRYPPPSQVYRFNKPHYANVYDSVIMGFTIGSSLLIGYLFELDKPYWLPISCMAVLQAMSLRVVYQRTIQRILGTIIGLLICWFVMNNEPSSLQIICLFFCLQFCVEVFIVRNYVLAVIFITPLTVFLADLGTTQQISANVLIATRFFDIIIGSLYGAAMGVLLHKDSIRIPAEVGIRRMTQKWNK